jgi:hypothetical protein
MTVDYGYNRDQVSSRLKRLVAGLSQLRPEFNPWSGFVVDEVALGQILLRVRWLSHAGYHSTNATALIIRLYMAMALYNLSK